MGKYINCQIIQLAQRVYHGKNQHSPQLGRSIILVKPRGNFADVKASDLAGSQDMFQQRKHRFRIQSQGLCGTYAWRKCRRKYIRADGNISRITFIQESVDFLQNDRIIGGLNFLCQNIIRSDFLRVFEQADRVAVFLISA